jgi:hypothetical protein
MQEPGACGGSNIPWPLQEYIFLWARYPSTRRLHEATTFLVAHLLRDHLEQMDTIKGLFEALDQLGQDEPASA